MCGAGAPPVLHEQAGRAGVQQRGQQRRLRQHERGRVVQRAPGQQERVVGQVGRVADLAQAAQPPARLAQQPRQQLACAPARQSGIKAGWVHADLAQAAQPPARLAQQPRQQLVCAPARQSGI